MDTPRLLPSRAERLEALVARSPDVLVVGGGITGAGIALDLALRGVRTGLVERGDWAGATSSASSRLVHGGLRYLEQLEVGLVRESCLERGLLLQNAAGLVWPELFTFPVRRGDRVGRWRLAAGLGAYALVSLPRALGLPRLLSRRGVQRRLPAVDAARLVGGGSYHDGATDDARLTLSVALSAAEEGAVALSRTELVSLEGGERGVAARLRDLEGGGELEVRARAAVLAGGPFTDGLRARAGLPGGWVRPTRGSHVLVPRDRLPTDGAVIFPSPVDGRMLFLIPWPRLTAIGTTDLDASPEDEPCATAEEVLYLLDSANGLCPAAELGPDDVVSSWSGLRPLLAGEERDPSARSREERMRREGSIYTIAGGKLTTWRAMAEKLAARLTDELGLGRGGRRSATRARRLRGAHPRPVPRPRWSWLDEAGRPLPANPLEIALARRYAAFAPAVAAACRAGEGAMERLDEETLLGEVDWAVRHEDCLSSEDFLLRRTDLGYGPPEVARRAAEPVRERLARRLGWNEARRARDAERLDHALARPERWRGGGGEVLASAAH